MHSNPSKEGHPVAILNNPYVPKDSLASTQINNIIKSDSPLMKSAETYAKQQSNQKGLLNSNLAVGTAQKGVIDAATPIGIADSQVYANSALESQRQKGNIDLQTLNNNFAKQLQDLKYDREDAQLLSTMVNAHTNTLMNQIGSLLNNPDIKMSDNVTKWMSQYMEKAWKSSASIFKIPIDVK